MGRGVAMAAREAFGAGYLMPVPRPRALREAPSGGEATRAAGRALELRADRRGRWQELLREPSFGPGSALSQVGVAGGCGRWEGGSRDLSALPTEVASPGTVPGIWGKLISATKTLSSFPPRPPPAIESPLQGPALLAPCPVIPGPPHPDIRLLLWGDSGLPLQRPQPRPRLGSSQASEREGSRRTPWGRGGTPGF